MKPAENARGDLALAKRRTKEVAKWKRNKHIGSSLQDFLQAMEKDKISKAEMARRPDRTGVAATVSRNRPAVVR